MTRILADLRHWMRDRRSTPWTRFSAPTGNAFAILGRTAAALRHGGVPQEEIDAFFAEATSGDYDHLLQTTMAWVDSE